jgi:hypothetical protein
MSAELLEFPASRIVEKVAPPSIMVEVPPTGFLPQVALLTVFREILHPPIADSRGRPGHAPPECRPP